MLDIGCGPGRFRSKLPDGTAYIGIDPLPILPEVTEFDFAHRFKDWIEDRRDGRKGNGTPHHMTEFTPASLADALGQHFEPVNTKNLPGPRLAPRKLMVSAQKP